MYDIIDHIVTCSKKTPNILTLKFNHFSITLYLYRALLPKEIELV